MASSFRHADLADALAEALEGTRRVADIVGELRMFARPEETDENRGADLMESLDLAMRLTSHTIRHKCTVEIGIEDGLRPVSTETGPLSQVFVNTLTNVADAMPPDRSETENLIRVTAAKAEVGNSVVISIVVESGVPVMKKPLQMERLFQLLDDIANDPKASSSVV